MKREGGRLRPPAVNSAFGQGGGAGGGGCARKKSSSSLNVTLPFETDQQFNNRPTYLPLINDAKSFSHRADCKFMFKQHGRRPFALGTKTVELLQHGILPSCGGTERRTATQCHCYCCSRLAVQIVSITEPAGRQALVNCEG